MATSSGFLELAQSRLNGQAQGNIRRLSDTNSQSKK
jgi:hypothetical protein